ncbi:unnamed protein product [Microthlaspi erraticum]|uniref:Uncharacterized protein n=1 Tax=Microthlaspi erraticum TaxID=1685480 RepID=A0A6D2HP65_9BRAS|nr:unnamed protein product [Microthlaspi erraticum]
MDFIKTSSLRALIELTFQRNWNGLIWMSRKGVIAKRVKTVQRSIENQRRTAQRLAEERMFRARPKPSVRLKSRPKFNHPADHDHDPGSKPAVGHATTATPRRARPCRASREKPRGRATYLAYHGRCPSEPGKRPTSGRETIGQILTRPTTPADREIIRPRPFRPTTTRLSGRPSRPTVRTPRSTRSRF